MEVIRNSKHNSKDYVIVDTTFVVQKGEAIISSPIHIRIDVTKLSEVDRAIVFGKANNAFNHVLTIKNKQQTSAKKSWWKKIFS
jgi:hypothetical protein